jgi:hypothetical protein
VTTGPGGSTSHLSVDVLASTLLGSGTPAAEALEASDSLATSVGLVLDGDDLSAENIAVSTYVSSPWSTVTVENCYVHGSEVGVSVDQAMIDPAAA